MITATMEARLDTIERRETVCSVVRHETTLTGGDDYITVFTSDDVAHIWADGSVTWESMAA